MAAALERVRFALPRGGGLSDETWARRHRGILVLLWAHVPAIVVFAVAVGDGVVHGLWECIPVVGLAAMATWINGHRRLRTVIASVGLLTCSAILVHLSDGLIEMHFHYFVMVGVITLYQDWLPFLVAIAYVVVQHGVMGALTPEDVYNHESAIEQPWTWAGIHGVFILGMSAAGIISWRLSEVMTDAALERGRQLAEAQQLVHLGHWEWDTATGSATWSEELFRLFGADAGTDPTYDWFLSQIDDRDRDEVHDALTAAYREQSAFAFDCRTVPIEGRVRSLHVQGRVVLDGDGQPTGVQGTMHDITARKDAERKLRRSQEASQLIREVAIVANQDTALHHAMRTSLEGVCAHRGWAAGHAYDVDEAGRLVPAGVRSTSGSELDEAIRALESAPAVPSGSPVHQALESGAPAWELALGTLTGPGWGSLDAAGMRSAYAFPVLVHDEVVAVLEFFSDTPTIPADSVTELLEGVGTQLGRLVERKRAQEALSHQVLHDPLTNLPNRTLFVERMGQALSGLGRQPTKVAVLFLDLDGFKVVNDSLGHDAGDTILIAVARRLTQVVRHPDTVARFGGDEFTVLCRGLQADQDAAEVAQRIADALVEPFDLNGSGEMVVTTSIGIAVADHPDVTPDELLRDADVAMYQAKQEGRARYAFFSPAMHEQAAERLALGGSLRTAIGAGELRLHFQPLWSLTDRRIVGVEALVRWEHPERGLLSPAQFIPVAESSGLIEGLGAWVLEHACHQLASWRAQGLVDERFTMSVNVSAHQLNSPGLGRLVRTELGAAGVAPNTLCLEITESVLMTDSGRDPDTLRALKRLGVKLSIDDFGTGYSSLAYLHRFPVDGLKIDRSFVADLDREPHADAIVKAIVDLSHALGLPVVAEGVETDSQVERLVTLGCDMAQGYLFARPAPADAIEEMLRMQADDGSGAEAPRTGMAIASPTGSGP